MNKNELSALVAEILAGMERPMVKGSEYKPTHPEPQPANTHFREGEFVPDVSMLNLRELYLVENPENGEKFKQMKLKTPARLGSGRAGPRYKTLTMLRFRADQGMAPDAVWSELEADYAKEQDLIPFQAGIQAGCDAILISHTIVEAWDPELPASLSAPAHQYLRNSMQFEGVILTDDLIMEAITDRYGAGEAAVMAVLAGNDLLCSSEYAVQYEAVLAAVLDGRIHLRILNAAVRNVLEWKAELGLLS